MYADAGAGKRTNHNKFYTGYLLYTSPTDPLLKQLYFIVEAHYLERSKAKASRILVHRSSH